MMFWFKFCRDSNVVDSDLTIEAVKSVQSTVMLSFTPVASQQLEHWVL